MRRLRIEWVTSSHEVGEARVVEKVEVSRDGLGEDEEWLEIDSFDRLDSSFVVTDEHINSELSNKREKSKVLRSGSSILNSKLAFFDNLRSLNDSLKCFHNVFQVPESEITRIFLENLL